VSSYRVVMRHRGLVERHKANSLAAALDVVEERATHLADEAHERPIDLKLFRRFDPVQQVFGRVELSGPRRLRAGVDVRGDGSLESFTGSVRRQLVEQRDGESALEALRRTLGT
jgi:hypothetical protein